VTALFVRIFFLWIASLMLAHFGFRYLNSSPPFVSGDTFDTASGALAQQDAELDLAADLANAHSIAPLLSIRPHIVDLRADVVPRLRNAVWEQNATTSASAAPLTETCSSSLSCLKTAARWIEVRFAALLVALGVFLLGLRAWWLQKVHRDLVEVAATLRVATSDTGPIPALAGRVRELHGLAGTLGCLLHRRSDAVEDRSAAFAAFLQQIESRVARLRVYAMNITRWNVRAALIEDLDLFQDVARQFVDTAGHGSTNHSPVSVEAYLKDRFVYGANADDTSIVLQLNAGDAFRLPRSALIRLIDNLVGNAKAHGAPPIEVGTTRGPRTWILSVRDHGEGLGASLPDGGAPASPVLASRAASLGLGSHWGIGLSIVKRLARQCNANLKIGNHPGGGLWVRVIVPMDTARQH
jgi:two-component system, OmpR family, osmolarity sensor histidine kinase EnvZ